MPRLIAIANGFASPSAFEAEDWAIEDPGTGNELRLILRTLPDQGTWPRSHVVYQAGAPSHPWDNPAEVIVDSETLASVLAGDVALPLELPFPHAVPNDADVGIVLRLIDEEANKSGVSDVKIGRATDATAGQESVTGITLTSTSVNEDAGVGTEIALISSDGSPTPTYAIAPGGDPDRKFDISGNRLVTRATLDYAAQTRHRVTIRATNLTGSFDQTFTVNVTQDVMTPGTVPAVAIHRSEIGPFAEIAMLRTYQPFSGPPTRTVSNAAQLQDALNTVPGGANIVAQPGDYSGISTSVNRSDPVHIWSQTYKGARLTGAHFLNANGYKWHGFHMQGSTALSGAHNGLFNCELRRLTLGYHFRNNNSISSSHGPRKLQIQDCIVDSNYGTGQNSWTNVDEITIRRLIMARNNGADHIQAFKCNGFDVENMIVVGNNFPRSDSTHSDMFQSFNPRTSGLQRWRFHRCGFYLDDSSEYKSCQFLFLADGAYRGVSVTECLMGPKRYGDGSSLYRWIRSGITIQFDGPGNLVANNSIYGVIDDINKTPADNSGTRIIDNICAAVGQSGHGGAYQEVRGNLEHGGSGAPYFVTSRPDGRTRGYDPRDFDAGLAGKGAQTFMDAIKAQFGA